MNSRILTCRFVHPYFQEGILQDFALCADQATAEFMQRYALYWQQNDTGITLYCQRQEVEGLLDYLHTCFGQLELCWHLIGNRERFLEITDLPDAELLSLNLYLRSAIQTTSDWLPMQSTSLPAGSNLSALATLRCQFADLRRAFQNQEKFQFEFQARKLHWVYLLINRSQQQLREPQIVLNDAISFSGPEHVQLENGEAALRFSALAESYVLQQVQQPQFDLQVEGSLVLDGQRQKQVLIKGLPTPQAGRLSLRRQASSSQVVSSEMYVYI